MTETPQEKAEAQAIRRRWITLGEVLAVVAVLISGLTFWNSYQERKSAEADRIASSQKAEKAETALVLKASVEDDGRQLAIAALDSGQAIQSQRILFPTAIGVAPVDTVADPRIEAAWIGDALTKQKDGGSGDHRVPVAIITRFVVDGDLRSDAALYQLAYRREGRFLQGSVVRLRGLALVGRIKAPTAQKRVDALWE